VLKLSQCDREHYITIVIEVVLDCRNLVRTIYHFDVLKLISQKEQQQNHPIDSCCSVLFSASTIPWIMSGAQTMGSVTRYQEYSIYMIDKHIDPETSVTCVETRAKR
jgi:hypothetical protein